MKLINEMNEARQYLKAGKIIAYPTEAVYGLGCDPFNQMAVTNLLALKHRANHKGLIILIADWQQLAPLIHPLSDTLLAPVHATWPGPVSWVFPKSDLIPEWLTGQYDTIAIRMSAHPIAHQLCIEGPIVSTSANISGQPPVINKEGLLQQFPLGIDALIAGELGNENQPSAIYDVCTGVRLR